MQQYQHDNRNDNAGKSNSNTNDNSTDTNDNSPSYGNDNANSNINSDTNEYTNPNSKNNREEDTQNNAARKTTKGKFLDLACPFFSLVIIPRSDPKTRDFSGSFSSDNDLFICHRKPRCTPIKSALTLR
jgi:hypothetical protein